MLVRPLWARCVLGAILGLACAPIRQASGPVNSPAQAPALAGERASEADSAEIPAGGEADPFYPPDSDAPDDEGSGFPEEVAASDEASPLQLKPAEELEKAWTQDPKSVGSISIGKTNNGALLNGVQMPPGSAWDLVDPSHAWGTRETVDALVRTIQKVHQEFPETSPLHIGHISSQNGGPLRPHKSHQSGRDVDLGYYYAGNQPWFARANSGNLDRGPTWALVRALITDTDVEMILIDSSLQLLLREHAASIGEDLDWLDSVFRGVPGQKPPLIRHAHGHATHMHVRFYSPVAEETARRLHSTLARQGKLAPTYWVVRARKGDTLGSLAKRYSCTVREIQRANNLHTTKIVAKRDYRVPRRGDVDPSVPPRAVPRRRTPAKKQTSR